MPYCLATTSGSCVCHDSNPQCAAPLRGVPWGVVCWSSPSASLSQVSGILVFVQDQFKLSLLETGNFAAALNAAAIVGALVSGWVADRFGRKPALFISSFMFTMGSFWMALANSYPSLLVGRYIQGYGVGAGLLISPMFISEIAPPAFRGS